MFSWKNHYYVDACTPSVKVVPDNELPEVAGEVQGGAAVQVWRSADTLQQLLWACAVKAMLLETTNRCLACVFRV
jgi:hypothetical protein